jgi:hypothetical protein
MTFSGHRIAPLIGLVILIVACAPGQNRSITDAWKFADLRILSSAGRDEPDLDLISAYTRIVNQDFQIRLDLLDLTLESAADLYIAIDTKPGGTRELPIGAPVSIDWDTLLIFPATGSPSALSADEYLQPEAGQRANDPTRSSAGLIPRISRLPWLDAVIVSINLHYLPASGRGLGLQAFISAPGSDVLSDSIGPFRSDGIPPPRAPVALAFWNTYPAYTSAQALRRWDGAHTGPFGERHGLSVLLHAVRRTRVPVILLDLRRPAALAALDYAGALPLVRELLEDGLLVLPDPLPGSPSFPLFPTGLPGWAPSQALVDVRTAARDFGLPASEILYAPRALPQLFSQYQVVFTSSFQEGVTGNTGDRYFPIPFERVAQPQADREGLSLEIRKTLLDNALRRAVDRDDEPLLILGGSFRDSPFGDPQVANASLSYIAGHPWLEPLTLEQLLGNSMEYDPTVMPGVNFVPNLAAFSPSAVLLALGEPQQEPANVLLNAAWQAAQAVYAPIPPEPFSLPALRSIYSAQVAVLSRAANWARDRQPRDTCLVDPDNDTDPECVLASENVYMMSDIDGGRMLSLFVATESGVHQVIAASTQFVIGTSDPSTWRIDANEGADPGAVHGAFADSDPPWDFYFPSQASNQIDLIPANQELRKRFSLLDRGVRVEYRNTGPVTIQIPIALDPWIRFTPSWGDKYHGEYLPDGYRWKLNDGPAVEIHTNGRIRIMPFNDLKSKLAAPEDPNFAYPRSYFLPFPTLLVEIKSARDFFVEIKLEE